jgi:predicted outer membrane repeat protein
MSSSTLIQRLSSCAAAILVGLSCATVHAGGLLTIYRVGVGPGCDFPTLQAAIDAGSTDPDDLTEIRLSATAANQALTLFTRNLTIDGRYSSCNSAVANDATRQTISGIGTDSVMRIANAVSPARQVILRNVVVRGGGPFGLPGQGFGGGLAITGAIDVTLLNSRVGDNESLRGAGISISGGSAALTLDQNTIVGADGGGLPGNRAVATGGAAAAGGGFQCVGGAMVTINDGRIRANSSTDDGGGAYINDCTLMIEPRPEFTGDGFVTFFQNTAGGNGGGLYAEEGSDIFWRSLPAGSFGGLATGNSAEGRGGAVFLTGLSNFVGDWLRFEDNAADDRGGAIAVQGSSNLILRGGPDFSCDGNQCPGIFGTRGITQGEQASLLGGAIYADTGGNVDLRQQRLFDNWASVGSAILLSGSTTTADLRSVLIARNVLYGVGNGTSTVDLISSAKIQMRYVTMAGNFRVSNVFPLIEQALSSIRANGNSATVELRNSSVWNDGVQVFRSLAGATATGSCVLAHENASFGPATIANPLYVDTTGDDPDYSLQPGSPAIDRCAASGTNEADVRGIARPQDLPQANLAGPFDAGAFEFALDDLIFYDGFQVLD